MTPDSKLFEILISFIIGLSGWIAFYYSYLMDKPKIIGHLFSQISSNANDGEKDFALISMFVYLVNLRKTAVHIENFTLDRNSEKFRE